MPFSWQYSFAVVLQAVLFIQVYSTTHWVVTEDGKIQAQMDSLFQLRRPYDFLALAQQEQRAVQVEELKQQLLRHKAHIDMHEDKDVHLEERIYRTDPDCLLAGKSLTEFDLTASTSVSLSDYPELKVEERLLPARDESGDLLEPDCEAAHGMPVFSMAAFDHLLGMQERRNLSGDPESDVTMLGVRRGLDDIEDPDAAGLGSDTYNGSPVHLYEDSEEENSDVEEEEDASVWGDRVARTLAGHGSSDWLVHSLATQYWRLRGEPLLAIECVRRALYLVPRVYRHIPLVQLGNLLHRSKLAHDAAVVLHSALDHHSTLYPAHLTLAHVYATMALYNVSAVCYSNAALLQPAAALPRKLRHAVLCHAHLEEALQQQHLSLQRTLSELQQYQQSHEEWLALHQKLLLEQATPEMKLESRLEYEEQKIRESSDGRGQDCFQYQQDGHTFLSCNMRRDQLEHRPQAADLLLDLTTLLHSVQGETMRLSSLRHQPAQASVQPVFRLQPHHLGGGWVVGRNGAPVAGGGRGTGPASPDTAECEEAAELPAWDSFPAVILLPGVKGFNVKRLLTEDIGESLEEPLSLPRHLPICDRLPSALPPMLERLRSADVTVGRCSRAATYLSKLGAEGDLQEAGHRVALALQKRAGPRWVLHNLAALYWRAVGNLWNGVECLRGVLAEEGAVLGELHHLHPQDGEDYDEMWRKYDTLFVDVALGNLASLLYAVGRVDDALALAQRAVSVADYVNETQFLLGNLLSIKGNVTGAMHHYEKALSLAPDHPHARHYLTALACHARHIPVLQQPAAASTQDGHKLWVAEEESELPPSSSEPGSGDADLPEDVELLSVKAFCEKGIDCSADSDSDGAGYVVEEDGDEDVAPRKQAEEPLEDARSKSFLSSALLPSLPPDPSTSAVPHSLPTDAEPSSFDAHVEVEDLPTADWLLRNKEAPDWLLSNAEALLGGGMAKEGDFCEGYKKTVALRHFTSTWLSVSAKYIDISTFLPEAPVPLPPQSPSPVCPSVPASLPSLDHLSGVRHRHQLPHLPEAGLLEALHTLVDPPQSMEQLGHRLYAALQQHAPASPGGWVVCTGAALYWRVEGNAENAIDCLRAALLHAPRDMRDVPLTSLANVLHRSGLYNNALIAANAALEISPKFVVIHFTLANILAGMGEYQKAATFYESTLALQSTFEPAKERLLAIYCEEHLDD